MLGQRANGNIVYASLGGTDQRLMVDIPGCFQLAAPIIQGCRLLQLIQRKIIQHHNVGSGSNGFFQLRQGFYFHLHRLVRLASPRCSDRCADPAAGRDVILLDQIGVKQAQAVIVSTTCTHGVFLCAAQSGQGFAGIKKFDPGVAYKAGEGGGQARAGILRARRAGG